MNQVIKRGYSAAASGNKLKFLCVLYDDPTKGMPKRYARDSIPTITHYANGQTAPTPRAIDFTPGQLLGSVSGALGLRKYLEGKGHQYLVTSDNSAKFEKELVDADVVISQPFWPAYLTKERLNMAKKLKLVITAGIGSDHTDLDECMKRDITVAEVTGSNSIGVAEHTVMQTLALLRNYLPSHDIARSGGWNIADCAVRSYDLEGMNVAVFGAGRIGKAVMKRLKPFDVKLHYSDMHRMDHKLEKELGATYHEDIHVLAKTADVLIILAPLTHRTKGLLNSNLLGSMKRGAYIVNPARALIADRDAIVKALKDEQLAGYAGDVWFPQPPPKDHPWRTMPNNGMTPHISGTTLSGQARYAAGTREIIECWLDGRPIRDEYLIVHGGGLAGTGAHSYS